MPKNIADKVNALRWRHEHPDEYRSYNKSWREQNAEHIRDQRKEWKTQNATHVLEYRRARYHKMKDTDTEYRILRIFRGRITAALKKQRGQRAKKSMDLLGCTIATARSHIESQFQPGMSWDNHGHHGWHIDHIIPCAAFDLTDPDQQAMCFHYTNLQPLWALDNMSKRDKLTPEALALIATSQETIETDVLPFYIDRGEIKPV